MSRPEPQVALVTGGTRGLGGAVAQRFARDGWHVVVCARTGEWLARMWRVLDDCKRDRRVQGGFSFQADVSVPGDVDRLVARTLGHFGRIDALVTCAGIYGPAARLDEAPWDEWRRPLEVNLLGTVLCCRAVLPVMRAQGRGKIVTIAGGGHRPERYATAYNASKGAVLRFTEALAADELEHGVHANAVAPGALDTLLRPDGPEVDDPARAIDNAVDLVAFLASPRSDGVTGRVLSAVWDDWEHLPARLEPDDYRVRRMVPA